MKTKTSSVSQKDLGKLKLTIQRLLAAATTEPASILALNLTDALTAILQAEIELANREGKQ